MFGLRLSGALMLGLVCACNVGAPLVDKLTLVDSGAPLDLPCPPPPHCAALEAIDTPANHALPVRLDDCPAPLTPSDVDCAAPGAQPSAADCAGRISPAELPLQLDCTQTRVAYADDTQNVSLDAAAWSHSNLTIAASHPLRIQLHAAALSKLFLSLEGPVLIQIDRPTTLSDVRISGIATNAGAPSLELTQATADALVVGDTLQSFPGEVTLRDVTLSDSVLAPDTLELESVSFAAIRISTHMLTATDVRFKTVQLDADSALISAIVASQVRMKFCAGATLVAGRILQSTLADCGAGAAIRLYNSEITGSMLDGVFESDDSHWENNVVGVLAPSDVTLFQTSLFATTFCDSLSKLAVGAQSHIKCSHCVRLFAEPDEFCSIPGDGAPSMFDSNYCPLFKSQPPPLECAEPSPERVRPLIDGPF